MESLAEPEPMGASLPILSSSKALNSTVSSRSVTWYSTYSFHMGVLPAFSATYVFLISLPPI